MYIPPFWNKVYEPPNHTGEKREGTGERGEGTHNFYIAYFGKSARDTPA